MGLDQSGVLTVGSLVPKEGRHTLPHNTLLVIPPWCSKRKVYSVFSTVFLLLLLLVVAVGCPAACFGW